jgi:hypothetical protein
MVQTFIFFLTRIIFYGNIDKKTKEVIGRLVSYDNYKEENSLVDGLEGAVDLVWKEIRLIFRRNK